MTDHTAKNLVGRELINLRDALLRTRPFIAEHSSASSSASELLMRIDTLVFKHADPEGEIAARWAAGDYSEYPKVKGTGMQHAPTCPAYGNYQPPYEKCTCGSEQ